MKHNLKATANAVAVVGGGLYIICAFWTMISKESFLGIMSTWTHSLDMNALPQKTPDFSSLIIGFVTFVATFWMVGYAFAACCNYFAKRS